MSTETMVSILVDQVDVHHQVLAAVLHLHTDFNHRKKIQIQISSMKEL